MIGSTRPGGVEPFPGNHASFTTNAISSSTPMMNEGIETNAVVTTMISLSKNLFLRSAAIAPSTTPVTRAMAAATRPSLTLVDMPSTIMSLTMRPRCLSEGPKSNFVTISLR